MADTMIRHHGLPAKLAQGESLSRGAAYRFFRDTGVVGQDVLLLSVADYLAMRGPTLDLSRWEGHLSCVRALLDVYFCRPDIVNPPKLVNGTLLIHEIEGLSGPAVGWVLERVREAQAMGTVHTEREALVYAREEYSRLRDVGS